MVLYGNFMLIMLLIFGVSSLATLFFFLWSHRKPYRIYGIVSFTICIFTFICMVIVGAIFSEESVLNVELDKNLFGTRSYFFNRLSACYYRQYSVLPYTGRWGVPISRRKQRRDR